MSYLGLLFLAQAPLRYCFHAHRMSLTPWSKREPYFLGPYEAYLLLSSDQQ